VAALILKRASTSRASGEWNEDVLADGAVVGLGRRDCKPHGRLGPRSSPPRAKKRATRGGRPPGRADVGAGNVLDDAIANVVPNDIVELMHSISFSRNIETTSYIRAMLLVWVLHHPQGQKRLAPVSD
jgi:hypothetical protein